MGLTTDPNDPRLSHGVDTKPLHGQHDVYLVLSDEELVKGFVRPVIRQYVHAVDLGGCGAVTTMGLTLCETYARDIGFYGATYCCSCRMHKAVGQNGEFYWCDENGTVLRSPEGALGIDPGEPWKVGT